MNIAQISTDGTHQIVILPEDFQLAGTDTILVNLHNYLINFIVATNIN